MGAISIKKKKFSEELVILLKWARVSIRHWQFNWNPNHLFRNYKYQGINSSPSWVGGEILLGSFSTMISRGPLLIPSGIAECTVLWNC